jgi:hypothetical protein
MLHAKELSNFPHHNNTRTTKILLLLVTNTVKVQEYEKFISMNEQHRINPAKQMSQRQLR